MPSPDLSDLVELRLYDKGPFDLVDRALADAAAKLPGWIPREGNTELVMLEEFGLTVAELIYAVNRMPGAVLDVLLRLYGVTRNLGTAPTATVRFTLSDVLGHALPAGTRVLLDLGGSAAPLVFATDVAVLAAPGAGTVDAAVTATSATALANGVAVGTPLDLLDRVAYVDAAAIQVPPAGGVDAEAEADWRARGSQLFGSLRSTLVLAQDFTNQALQWPGVFRATTIDNWDATAGGGAGAAANGHVTVAVYGPGGVALSAGAKTDLAADLDAKALANLAVHVIDPTVTAVAVTATVHRFASFDDATVTANVAAALAGYLSTDSWPWDPVVRRNSLIALLAGVDGVAYVEVLTAPAADVNLPGAAPLATLGAVATTVNH